MGLGSLPERVADLREALRARTAGLSLKDWSEISKNFAQIVAFVVAAIWTYQMFVQKEAPMLQRHATTGGNFIWSASHDGKCEGSYYVSLKNDGRTDFDVRQVRLRMWMFESPGGSFGYSFVDLAAIKAHEPVFDKAIRDGAFVRHFPPGHERNERFAWFFRKEPERNILVNVDFFTDASATEAEWTQYYWWTVCPDVSASLPR